MKTTILRSIFVLLLSCLVASSASAQLFVGVESGITVNSMANPKDKDPAYTYGSRAGFSFGVPLRYQLKKWNYLSVSITPTLCTKNYYAKQIGYFGARLNYRNTYLDFPIAAAYQSKNILKQTEKSLRWFAQAGVYVSFWAAGRLKGESPLTSNPYYTVDVERKYSFDSDNDRRTQWGSLLGAGLRYAPSKKIELSVEARLALSQSTQFKSKPTNYPLYSDTFFILIGVQTNWQRLFGTKQNDQ